MLFLTSGGALALAVVGSPDTFPMTGVDRRPAAVYSMAGVKVCFAAAAMEPLVATFLLATPDGSRGDMA